MLLVLPMLMNAQRRLDLRNYELVWRDEFNYTDVDAMLDSGNWVVGWPGDIEGIATFHQWEFPAGNGRPYATKFTKDNILLEDGIAYFWGSVCDTLGRCDSIIIPGTDSTWYQIGSFGGAITTTYDQDYPCVKTYYDDGDTLSLVVKGFNYGVFEIRAKLPQEEYDFSYFWLWGPYWQCGNEDHHATCGPPGTEPCQLPYCSGIEIDVFETSYAPYRDSSEFRYFSTIQPNNADGDLLPAPHQCASCPTYYRWVNSNPSETWHTYALAWTPDSATWFIDGNEIRTQRDYIPDFKMVLNLGANLTNYSSPGPQGELAVDYVRLYRPTGGNYDAITDTFPTSTMVTGRDTSAYGDYVALYRDTATSYFNHDNYRFKEADDLPLPPSSTPSSSAMIEPYDAVQEEKVPTCYFTLGDVMLYRTYLSYNRQYMQYSDALRAYQYSMGWVRSEIANISKDPNSIDMLPVARHLFYRDGENFMYMRIHDAGQPEQNFYVVQMSDTADVAGDVVAVEGDEVDTLALHHSRVYYRNTDNRLCFFEYDPDSTNWYRYPTNITNVAGPMVASKEPEGQLYYKGTDNYLWTVTVYDVAPDSFVAERVSDTSDFTNEDALQLGALAVSPDGDRVYYSSFPASDTDPFRARIKCYERGLTSWHERQTGVADFMGDHLAVRASSDGGDEVFYTGNAFNIDTDPAHEGETKLKAMYPRPSRGKWEGGLLDTLWADTCVTTLDNMTQNHRPTYYVEPHFYVDFWFEASETEPRVLFAKAQHRTLGFYTRGSHELCPLIYEECNWNPETTNEIEFRVSGPPPTKGELSIYPNPTDGQVRIVLPEHTQAKELWLSTLGGQALSMPIDPDVQAVELDLSGFPPGVYGLRVLLDDGQVLVGKIVLQTRP